MTSSIHANQERVAGPDEFDIHEHLETVLAGVGLAASDCGGRVSFEGEDPIIPSPLRLGSAAGIGLAAKPPICYKSNSGGGTNCMC